MIKKFPAAACKRRASSSIKAIGNKLKEDTAIAQWARDVAIPTLKHYAAEHTAVWPFQEKAREALEKLPKETK